MIDLWCYGPRYIVPSATPATSLGGESDYCTACVGGGMGAELKMFNLAEEAIYILRSQSLEFSPTTSGGLWSFCVFIGRALIGCPSDRWWDFFQRRCERYILAR